jgi:hypothetical protein
MLVRPPGNTCRPRDLPDFPQKGGKGRQRASPVRARDVGLGLALGLALGIGLGIGSYPLRSSNQ